MTKRSTLFLQNGNKLPSSHTIKSHVRGFRTPALHLFAFRTGAPPLSKAIFCGKDGKTYGRIFLGGSLLPRITNSICPLYFTVVKLMEVMSTEQPCDLAYEFGDGLLDLHEYPEGFPKPAKHPWPFDDYVVVYIRHVGPGVMVGQAWQEGKALEQVPRKFCGEILMVKDYTV